VAGREPGEDALLVRIVLELIGASVLQSLAVGNVAAAAIGRFSQGVDILLPAASQLAFVLSPSGEVGQHQLTFGLGGVDLQVDQLGGNAFAFEVLDRPERIDGI